MGELDSPGLDCGHQPDHAPRVVCREAKEEGRDPGGLGLWAMDHRPREQSSNADSLWGRQAADQAENPSWQQSCICTFFFIFFANTAVSAQVSDFSSPTSGSYIPGL